MKGFFFSVAASLAVLSGSSAAHARGDEVLQPSGNWHVQYGEHNCGLSREFSNADGDIVYFEMRASVPAFEQSHLALASKDITLWPAYDASYRWVGLEDAEEKRLEPHMAIANGVRAKGFAMLLDFPQFEQIRFQIDQEEIDAAGDEDAKRALVDEIVGKAMRTSVASMKPVNAIVFDEIGPERLTLETGSMAAPLAAFKQCLFFFDQSIMERGSQIKGPTPIDAEAWQAKVGRIHPYPFLAKKFRTRVDVELEIDAEGKPVDCYITGFKPDEKFEETACTALLEHAKFEPALDAEGKPTRGWWGVALKYTSAN